MVKFDKLLQVRTDQRTEDMVDAIQDITGKKKSEIVRMGIKMLYADILTWNERGGRDESR